MSLSRRRRVTGVLAAVAAASTGIMMAGGTAQAHQHGRTINVQVLSFNDFHGNLEPPAGSSGRVVTDHALSTSAAGVTTGVAVNTDAGGVEYLATHLRDARRGNRNTVTVAAGDIVGASPLLSAAFHDEPTIEAMNKLGLEATAVGNHEFDEGYKELQRLQRGGCLPDGAGLNNQNSCAAGIFRGARFQFLAANVKYSGTSKTILPSYWVKKMNGAKIGFIGMTLKETPNIVTKAGIAGLDFTDEVATANALVPVLERQGVKAIVVLIHQGGAPAVQSWTGPDGKAYNVGATYDYACGKGGTLDPSSPILPIAANLSPQIDLVISGHTHQPYVCNVPDPKGQQRMVTSASSFGRLFTETNLTYDLQRGDIVRSSVKGSNMVVSRDVTKAPDETRLVDTYKALIAPIAGKVLGNITTDVTAAQNLAGESTLGDLIADAQVNDPSVISGVKPAVAFMNPGGIRADLTYPSSAKGEGDGVVTYEEAFTVQPFNNYLVSMDLTGAQISALLQQQWSGLNATSPKMLQISQGLAYAWHQGAAGRELVAGSLKIGGQPVVDTATYRIVTNNFLSDGGDGFPAFIGGGAKVFGGLDIDGFAGYLPTVSPYTPAALGRITIQ
jgi:5'-nucleotidase